MALLTDQLVGRTEELGSFEQVLAEVDRGDFVAVELIGEPGIGKSRLLREFAGRADTQGRLVLAGSGSELERELPFAFSSTRLTSTCADSMRVACSSSTRTY